MAVQQRIIGGGLLIAGIAVVLILIFLFASHGMPFDEAYGKLRKEIYPRYVKADEEGDYEALRHIAEEARKIEKDTTMRSVMQEVKSDAAKGEADARELQRLIESDAFEKNTQGLYAIDGQWYDSSTHAALRRMKRALDEAVPALLAARKGATAVAAELLKLRLGSGLELAQPAPDTSIRNPLVEADAVLLRVLGLPAGDITKALNAKGESAKAKSARLVWNQTDSASERARLAKDLAAVPTLADKIERAAVSLAQAEQDLKGRDGARKQASEILKRSTGQLATVLEGPARQAFEAEATITSVADALKQDARLLKGYASNAPAVGQALVGDFAP